MAAFLEKDQVRQNNVRESDQESTLGDDGRETVAGSVADLTNLDQQSENVSMGDAITFLANQLTELRSAQVSRHYQQDDSVFAFWHDTRDADQSELELIKGCEAIQLTKIFSAVCDCSPDAATKKIMVDLDKLEFGKELKWYLCCGGKNNIGGLEIRGGRPGQIIVQVPAGYFEDLFEHFRDTTILAEHIVPIKIDFRGAVQLPACPKLNAKRVVSRSASAEGEHLMEYIVVNKNHGAKFKISIHFDPYHEHMFDLSYERTNLGKTCFMNSVLHGLSNIPELTEYFLLGKYIEEINESSPLGTGGRLVKAYADVINGLWSGNQNSVRPHNLRSTHVCSECLKIIPFCSLTVPQPQTGSTIIVVRKKKWAKFVVSHTNKTTAGQVIHLIKDNLKLESPNTRVVLLSSDHLRGHEIVSEDYVLLPCSTSYHVIPYYAFIVAEGPLAIVENRSPCGDDGLLGPTPIVTNFTIPPDNEYSWIDNVFENVFPAVRELLWKPMEESDKGILPMEVSVVYDERSHTYDEGKINWILQIPLKMTLIWHLYEQFQSVDMNVCICNGVDQKIVPHLCATHLYV